MSTTRKIQKSKGAAPAAVTLQVVVERDLTRWPEPVFSNLLSVSRSLHDVTFFFSAVRLPLLEPGEQPPDPIVATPVARIVMPITSLQQVAQSVQEILGQIQEEIRLRSEEAGGGS